MGLSIAGSEVLEGDHLYSRRLNNIGTVTKVEGTHATLRFLRNGVARELTVMSGGVVAGEKDVFWNPPIELDLPKNSSDKYAKIVSFVNALTEIL